MPLNLESNMLPDQMPRKPEAEAEVWPLPCPFCGSAEVSTHEGSTFRWMYAGCDQCGAQAGEVRVQTLGDGAKDTWLRQGRLDAIEEWNKRHNNQGNRTSPRSGSAGTNS